MRYNSAMVNFYLKKDNYEKLQKATEAKREKDVTQQDVDRFNQAVDAYNQAVNSSDQRNATANEKRTDQLNQWNKSVEAVFGKHAG